MVNIRFSSIPLLALQAIHMGILLLLLKNNVAASEYYSNNKYGTSLWGEVDLINLYPIYYTVAYIPCVAYIHHSSSLTIIDNYIIWPGVYSSQILVDVNSSKIYGILLPTSIKYKV